jgi:hypothetical protein
MGGVEQRPEDFDRNVARKFEEAGISFEQAWRAALEYVSKFPRHVLRDPQKFYKLVYEPVRDSFVEKVILEKPSSKPKPITLSSTVKSSREQSKRAETKRTTLLDWLKEEEQNKGKKR